MKRIHYPSKWDSPRSSSSSPEQADEDSHDPSRKDFVHYSKPDKNSRWTRPKHHDTSILSAPRPYQPSVPFRSKAQQIPSYRRNLGAAPVKDFAGVGNTVPAIVEGTTMTRCSVPDVAGTVKYQSPDIASFVFDRTSGFRFDPTTGLHYDANSGLFINLRLKLFLRWDSLSSTYVRVDENAGFGSSTGMLSGRAARNVEALPLTVGLKDPTPSTSRDLPRSGFQPMSAPISKDGVNQSHGNSNSVLQAAKNSVHFPELHLLGGSSNYNNMKAEVSAPSFMNVTAKDSFMHELWKRMKSMASEIAEVSNTNTSLKNLGTYDSDNESHLSSPRSKGNNSKRRKRRSSSEESTSNHSRSTASPRRRRGGRYKSRRSSRSSSTSDEANREHSRTLGRRLSRGRSRSHERSRTKFRSRLHRGRSRSRSLSAERRKRYGGESRWSRGGHGRSRSRSLSVDRSGRARRRRSRSLDWRRRRRSFSRGCSWSVSKPRKPRSSRGYETSRSRSRHRKFSDSDGSQLEWYGREGIMRNVEEFSGPNPKEIKYKDSLPVKEALYGEQHSSGSACFVQRLPPRTIEQPTSRVLNFNSSEGATQLEHFGALQDDSDNASEFDFLKDTLDDDDHVEEHNQIRDDNQTWENSAYLKLGLQTTSQQIDLVPPQATETKVVDVGDVFSHLFTPVFNDVVPTNIILVAPVPLRDDMKNSSDLKTQIVHCDLLKIGVYHASWFGSPHHYMLLVFRTVGAVKQFYQEHGGSIVLIGDGGSKLKGYLHFSEWDNWECTHCHISNFPGRSLCRRCFQSRNNGFSPVRISKAPTRWVGIAKLKSCYSTSESVIKSLPPLHVFNLKRVECLKEPTGLPLGLCIFELQSISEGVLLHEFLRKRGRSAIYVIANEKPELRNDPQTTQCSSVDKLRDEASADRDARHISSLDPHCRVDDVIAPLFTVEPSNVLIVAPILLSKVPEQLKTEFPVLQTYIETLLEEDKVEYNGVTIHVSNHVGAPFSYGLITFSNSAAADQWCKLHSNALTIDVGRLQDSQLKGVQVKTASLYFCQGNWECRGCHVLNFPPRSLCHHCFLHRDKEGLSPFTQSLVITRWVATSLLPKWPVEDEQLIAHYRSLMKDFKLVNITVLRDPKCALALGFVFETTSWGESLELREFLLRTGRLCVFVLNNSQTVASSFISTVRQYITVESVAKMVQPVNVDCESSLLGVGGKLPLMTGFSSANDFVLENVRNYATLLYVNSQFSDLSGKIIRELVPDPTADQHLRWWNDDTEQYSEVLNNLFVENPLTRTSPNKFVFVGPLPIAPDVSQAFGLAYYFIIEHLLRVENLQYNSISIHVGESLGAPCGYGLVCFKTASDAQVWVEKLKTELILPWVPSRDYRLPHWFRRMRRRERHMLPSILDPSLGDTPPTPWKAGLFKSFVYYSARNWKCLICLKYNFGLRSNCFWCYADRKGNPAVITISSIPTKWICVRCFEKWSSTVSLLFSTCPFLQTWGKLKSVLYVKEDSGIPLGAVVLETGNANEGKELRGMLPETTVFVVLNQSRGSQSGKSPSCDKDQLLSGPSQSLPEDSVDLTHSPPPSTIDLTEDDVCD